MTKLPEGWSASTLGALGRYLNGRGFKKSEWRESGRPIIRIQNLTGSGGAFNYYQGDVEDRYVARTGDLLVSWAATLGAHIWNGPEAVVNQHIFKVESNIDRKFHKYLLDYKLDELIDNAHGSGMVHITRGRFESVQVAVPDSVEQRQIVDILEGHLSRLDASNAGVEAARLRLLRFQDRLLKSRLIGEAEQGRRSPSGLAATDVDDGTLAHLPDGWRWARLSELADVVGGVTKDASRQSDPAFVEVPYLRVANVQRGQLDLAHVARIRVPETKAIALRLRPGDVLLNEGGDRDKLARGWVWEGQIEDCIHQNHVFRARVRGDQIDPRILSWAANTLGASWAERNGKQSVNLASISLSKIRRMPIPVPPRPLQVNIVNWVSDQLEGTERLSKALRSASRKAHALRRALLAAAFSGRLTRRSSDMDLAEEMAGV